MTDWITTESRLPDDETPVLIIRNGVHAIGELRWEHPGFEDTFKAFRYWDDPVNDGQDWEWHSVTHWMPLPDFQGGIKRLCADPKFQPDMGASGAESARIALLQRAGVVSLAELERDVFDGIVGGYMGKGK